jgi:cytochrome c-type biogenesis protein CcmF
LFAWVVLGSGILLGAQWAYEVLGWGGYWSWDPVENGSLVPWLTGTALIHCLMAWKCAGVLKRTALGLALATFGLCNFATFLTRSGIFGSLHEFSRSPIGWLFLALMLAIALGGIALMVWRRSMLVPQRRISSIGSREAMICLGVLALVLLAVAALAGTTAAPLSRILLGRTIVVGQPFYNNVLVPTGLCLLAAMAAVPLLRWNASPSLSQKRLLLVAASAAVLAGIGAFAAGVRHPIALAVAGLATLSLVAPLAVLVGQVFNLPDPNGKLETCPTAGLLARYRRQYAGFLIHCGFACLAVGVTGSSLGTQRHELTMTRGETVAWTGRSILYVDLIEHELPDKLVVHAQLEISQEGTKPYVLLPAQVLYRSQNTWGTEVAIHSTWSEDFYTILHAGEGRETVNLTLIASPMVRWMWLAGWIGAAGAVIGLWPNRRHTPASARSVGSNGPALQRPHWTRAPQHQDAAHD